MPESRHHALLMLKAVPRAGVLQDGDLCLFLIPVSCSHADFWIFPAVTCARLILILNGCTMNRLFLMPCAGRISIMVNAASVNSGRYAAAAAPGHMPIAEIFWGRNHAANTYRDLGKGIMDDGQGVFGNELVPPAAGLMARGVFGIDGCNQISKINRNISFYGCIPARLQAALCITPSKL